MSDTPEYILRKPIEAIESNTWHTFKGGETVPFSERPYEVLNAGSEPVVLFKNEFEDLFVSLDRQALTEQLLKLIEDHNDGLLFTASSCSDYFREEEARGLLSWAATKSEDGNSMNTFLAKEIMALFGLENKETETE